MKRGWAALALILIAAGMSCGESLYLDSSIHTCVEMLNEADAHMERNEVYAAQSLAERADHRFESEAGVYDILMYHSEVTEVGKGLAELRRYAQTGSTAEFLAASARIKRMLLSMHNAHVLKLGNIL